MENIKKITAGLLWLGRRKETTAALLWCGRGFLAGLGWAIEFAFSPAGKTCWVVLLTLVLLSNPIGWVILFGYLLVHKFTFT